MNEPIITLESISKQYLINHEMQPGYSTLVEALSDQAKKCAKFLSSFVRKQANEPSRVMPEKFWAVKDINCSINAGECVGIIGRNGAGKSTLLKIMSRIVIPTTGRMIIKGRLASLLEVATGFHQELSGRENIFLNGSLLGMRRKDILKKFDEIVAFSGVEKFLDTPVKRYSSGMYTRLGFSIAAHLEPDILIVDEVLSVGDFAFQERCMQKLNTLSKEGKTIIFVSHDINSVVRLCTRAIYLQNGEIAMMGKAEDCALAYMNRHNVISTFWKGASAHNGITITQAVLQNAQTKQEYFVQGDNARIEISYFLENQETHHLLVDITDARGLLIASSWSTENQTFKLSNNSSKAYYDLDTSLLFPGEYIVKIKPFQVGKSLPEDEILLKLVVYARKNELAHNHTVWGVKLNPAWIADK